MKELRGYSMILTASVFWGLSATAAKILLNRDLDPILLVQTRVTFSFLLLLSWHVAFRRQVLRVKFRDLWRFALLGIVGIAGSNITYYITIRESTVATAILIQYTAPLLVMAYGALAREELVTPVKVVAAAVSLAGCFLAVGAYDTSILRLTPLGLVTGIASAFVFAFMVIYPRRVMRRYSLWTVTIYALGSASALWAVVNPPWKIAAAPPDPGIWPALLALAVGSVLIPHSLYFAGLRYVMPSRAIITSTCEPIVAIVSAALVVRELLAPLQVVGAVLVLSAIALLQVYNERPPQAASIAPATAEEA
jgi:drug/metabolite transporter (DMT)-like permease